MNGRVLVAYATRYGSTEEVARVVAQRLAARGVAVETKPAREVPALDPFDGVVIAAPYYIGSLLKDARGFLDRHREALEHKPIAVLALGPISAEDDIAEARQQLDGTLAKQEWLKPVAAEMFVGKYDPATLRGLDRLVKALPASPLHGKPAADDRDWDAIAGWVDQLPDALGLPV